MSFVYKTGIVSWMMSVRKPESFQLLKNKINTLLHTRNRKDKERTFFSAFKTSASLTIEAALVVPVFMFFAAGLLSFLSIISLQFDLQNGLDEISRNLDRKAYIAHRDDLGGIVPGPLPVALALAEEPLKNRLDSSGIKGGSGGVYPYLSTYDSETGILDVVVSYDYEVPVIPGRFSSIHFAQRMRSRAWIGRELDSCGDDASDEAEEDRSETKIYVTATGSVYHTHSDCSYLDLSIHTVNRDNVETMRNKSGSRYGCCPLCSNKDTGSSNVYITDYGENWHTSLLCSGLKRTIIEKDISEIGDMPLCSKCGSRH